MLHIYWVAFLTIIRSETHRIFRIWTQTLLPPVITTVLYFLIFGRLIGPRIGTLDGFSYIQFIAPGLIMMTTINNSYNHVVGSVFSSRFQRSIEALLMAPVPNIVLLLGFVTGGILRGTLVGIFITFIALCFTHLTIVHVGITILVFLLSSTLFALAGFSNALFARNFDEIMLVPTFILTPLTYLGGVFYSINMLPEWWKNLSFFNPILYIINGFRDGILGVSDVHIGTALIVMTTLVIVLFIGNLYLLHQGRGLRS